MDGSALLNHPDRQLQAWADIAHAGSFEACLEALDRIVAIIDEGNLPLDLTVRCYETGAALADRCRILLDEAELRISQVTLESLDARSDADE